ncbi:MAG: efflux RND transporter periplasmic adaptor subunit [Bacteroidales bacterium]|nr:efflux RND transporter periplasmic adaptor subunit [Bacteroidales bacterium]
METSKKSLSRATLKKSRTNLILSLVVLLTVIILISIIGWIVLKPEAEMIQGEVEANEVRVSGKLAGRIQAYMVEEGSRVNKGDTLLLLSSPELYAKLAQAEAAESAANAQNRKAIKGARSEQIQGAFEMWQKAKVGMDIAEKTFNRAKKLYENEVIPAQKFDEAEAQYHAAVATERAATTQYDMAKNGAEKEDKLAARALVDRAKGAVSEVQAYMPETQLTAPITGEISEIFPKQGELVGQGAPIMNIVDLNDCWITFNIREDQLAALKMGTIIKASIPAIATKNASFKITYLKALGSYATWKATKTTGEFDVKTFEIRAKPVGKIEGLRPGMTVLMVDPEN